MTYKIGIQLSDRELLELAAKAAGHKGIYHEWWDDRDIKSCGIAPKGACGREWWNPLTDGGDALRLAVRLDLIPDFMRFSDMHMKVYVGDEKLAETRRAIVRAAAAIALGKATP